MSDGHGGTDEAVVWIKINRPPVAVLDDRSTMHNRPMEIPVFRNDTDPDQDPLQVVRYTTASARGGAVRLKGSDLVVYTPPRDFVGTDQLQYTVSDGRGGTATTVVNIVVKAAAATQKSVAGETDSSVTISLTDEVLAIGSDWQQGVRELDEVIRLLSLERR